MDRLLAGVALPSSNRGVDVEWIELEAVTHSSDAFSGNQGTSGTKEAVEHDVASARGVEENVSKQADRFDAGMKLKKIALIALSAEIVHSCISPNVRPIATMTPELDVISVGAASILENEDEFVLRAIE